MDNVDCSNFGAHDPINRILKRQSERKKAEEKSSLEATNIEEIEKFMESFNEKQKEIEKNLEITETVDRDKLYNHFSNINGQIQELHRLYSNSTFFLRIYDKKICQSALHSLQVKFQDIENRLRPKKKFGFKTKKNKIETVDVKNGVTKTSSKTKNEKFQIDEVCGFCRRNNEVLILEAHDIEKKDVLLSDIKNCSIKLFGNPSTLHVTNMQECQVFCGPVTTSVFVENVKDSTLHLACQQLRIHETSNTDFFVHVTSKAIIEDSQDVRFGVYKLSYEGIDEHYNLSGLNRHVNNWDKVDDFNWLAVDKPSPNWSKLLI